MIKELFPPPVLPVASGFCDQENVTLLITHGTLDQYWIPFIGNVQLSLHSEHDGYILRENGTHLTITVPHDSPEVVHEVCGFHKWSVLQLLEWNQN